MKSANSENEAKRILQMALLQGCLDYSSNLEVFFDLLNDEIYKIKKLEHKNGIIDGFNLAISSLAEDSHGVGGGK